MKKTKNNLSSNIFLRKPAHALYQPYKWLIFISFLGISTFVLFLFALLTVILFGPKTCSAVIPPFWARLNSWMTPMLVKTYGKELIDHGQSYVVVSNHQSHYDILVLCEWLGIDIKWMMKKELRKIPLIGYITEKMGYIFIDRTNNQAAIKSINRAKKKTLPESQLSFSRRVPEAQPEGLVRLRKVHSDWPLILAFLVLPVTILETRDILPKNTLDLLPGKVDMIVHPPIHISVYDRDNLEPLIEKTRGKIVSAMSMHQG